MAYLDNLVAWGDALFRQDTGESINEATQLYVLAANLLGPRPQEVPRRRAGAPPQTYASLRSGLDAMATRCATSRPPSPFDLAPPPTAGRRRRRSSARWRSLGATLYFCVPRNDKLLAYWDTVADRLFKIRNSLNHRGRVPPAPAVRPADRPGDAGPRGRRGARRRRRRQRAQPAAAAGPLPGAGSPRASELCHEVKRSAGSCCPRSRRRTPRRWPCCAAGRSGSCWSWPSWCATRPCRKPPRRPRRWQASLAAAIVRYVPLRAAARQRARTTSSSRTGRAGHRALERMRFVRPGAHLATRSATVSVAQNVVAEAAGAPAQPGGGGRAGRPGRAPSRRTRARQRPRRRSAAAWR